MFIRMLVVAQEASEAGADTQAPSTIRLHGWNNFDGGTNTNSIGEIADVGGFGLGLHTSNDIGHVQSCHARLLAGKRQAFWRRQQVLRTKKESIVQRGKLPEV